VLAIWPIIVYEYTDTLLRTRRRDDMMNWYLAEQIAKDRLKEARALARAARFIDAADSGPDPLRVTIGLALIRLGRSLAGRTAKRAAGPRRATA
jgi:hypothetical protein